MWIHIGLLAAFVLTVLALKPFPQLCFLKPSGWFLAPGSLMYFWLPAIWAFIVLIHFFVVSALTVDERKAVLKSREIRAKSVDFSHMKSIMGRQWEGDDSVVNPADPRRKKDYLDRPRNQDRSDD